MFVLDHKVIYDVKTPEHVEECQKSLDTVYEWAIVNNINDGKISGPQTGE